MSDNAFPLRRRPLEQIIGVSGHPEYEEMKQALASAREVIAFYAKDDADDGNRATTWLEKYGKE